MSANGKNTVTNTQESFFRALTKTSVTIEAVDPVEVKAETVEPVVVAPVKDKTKTVAPVQAEDKIETKKTERDLLRTIGTILLGLLGLLLIIALVWFLFNQLASPRNTAEQAPASAPIVNPAPALPNNDVWTAVLTSANSNGNFIGDMGGRGNGAVIPTEATDLGGKTWSVGRALLTYCENASTCLYMFAKPGDILPRAFNVNLYSPEFTGDLTEELRYINTGWNNNSNVSWTYYK